MSCVIKKEDFIRKRSFFPGYTSEEQFKELCCVQSCGKFLCTKEYRVDRSDFDSYLLYYVCKGKSYLEYHDRKYILKEGDAFLIDCNDHQIYGSDRDEPCTITHVHFTGGCSKYYYDKIISEKGNVYSGYEGSVVEKGIENTFESIEKSNKNKVEILSNIINNILSNLLVYVEKVSDIEEAIKFIKRSVVDNVAISVEDVAKSVGYSKYHFTKKFKNIYGLSPYEYIIKERIELSKNSLVNSNDSIHNIAYKCGFNDTSHFTNCFKKRENLSPSKFREKWKFK